MLIVDFKVLLALIYRIFSIRVDNPYLALLYLSLSISNFLGKLALLKLIAVNLALDVLLDRGFGLL